MGLMTRIADKTGALGSVVSALDDWCVDLGFHIARAPPLRPGRLRTPRQAYVIDG